MKLDDSNILSEAQNETRHEIEKSFTLEMVRRAKDAHGIRTRKISYHPLITKYQRKNRRSQTDLTSNSIILS